MKFAAWEHERAGHKIDLVMALHHEHFESRLPVTQNKDSGGGNGRGCGFGVGHGAILVLRMQGRPGRSPVSPGIRRVQLRYTCRVARRSDNHTAEGPARNVAPTIKRSRLRKRCS